ncbi:TonB-dependent receptor [Elysia marginata]|uniref:TonB-dependent receptor n=1 Tax=Elysia marginata TaxID=1093978 RepID=A0AAV4G7X8_9GAST|nr:TonB-dependent receptor [Elysia marginata]
MNGEPLAFANVLVEGTSLGVTTDFDGNYVFEAIDEGVYTIIFSFLGYKTLKKEGVQITSAQDQTLNITLDPDSMSLEEVVVSTISRKESEEALLTEQKNIIQIKTAIGASEISRKGMSNVRDAVTNISSVSRQKGSENIYVRGLGDRYNITTLNGLPMPSNNPRQKNPTLSIFSTGIVEAISVSKIYDPLNYGDFSGANIDIISKNYSGRPFVKVRVSAGANSNAIEAPNFRLQKSIPKNNFGFATPTFNNSLNNEALKTYTFNSWDNRKVELPANFGIRLIGGNSFTIAKSKLNMFLVASHRNNFSSNEGILKGNVDAAGRIRTNYKTLNFGYNTNTTLMGNFSFVINPSHNIRYNTLFINSTNQDHNEYRGYIDKDNIDGNGDSFMRRSPFNRTEMIINQLLGKHLLSKRLDLDWRAGLNIVDNKLNRIQNIMVIYEEGGDKNKKRFPSGTQPPYRLFQHLKENEISVSITTSYRFAKHNTESGSFKGKLILGYSARFKRLIYGLTQFYFDINDDKEVIQPPLNVKNLDAYFNADNFNKGLFRIKTLRGEKSSSNALKPSTYSGNQYINAFVCALQYKLSPKLQLLLGLRAEMIFQKLKWMAILDKSEGKHNYSPPIQILPSLSLKYALNDAHNIKLGFSNTYTLPQFKERAPFPFDLPINQEFGNPKLTISKNYNADVKWEWFPSIGDLISLSAFYKYIINPINQVKIASASKDFSYVNSGDFATVLGVEVELRKKIVSFASQTGLDHYIRFGTNFSYMNTNQDISNEKVAKETDFSIFSNDKNTSLTGASDLLLNFDINYLKAFSGDRDFSVTTYYSFFSDRIFVLGGSGVGDQVDKSFGTLNVTGTIHLSKQLDLRLNFGNLLNPEVKRIQKNKTGDTLLLSYREGINGSLMISCQF